MLTTNELGGKQSTRVSLCGPSLTEILSYASGNAQPPPPDKVEHREIYDAMQSHYDYQEVVSNIEQSCRFNAIKPHLIDASTAISEPIPVLSRYGSTIASEGNISAIVGQAKSKKTFLCTALIGAMLRPSGTAQFGITPKQLLVLWVDTEQAPSHVQKVIRRIHRMAGVAEDEPYEMLKTLTLREIEPKERFNVLRDAIAYYKPKMVVVDGISDLMYNSNCIEESDAVVGELMALSTEFNCHIMSVLHTNPNSDKARGHIGSTLQRKVETMIYVHKAGDCSVVEPQFCRNEEFSPFAFAINDEGLPEECGMPSDSSNNDLCVQVMQEYFPNGVERSVLTNKLVDQHDLSRPLASVKITRAISRGLLIAEDNQLRLP